MVSNFVRKALTKRLDAPYQLKLLVPTNQLVKQRYISREMESHLRDLQCSCPIGKPDIVDQVPPLYFSTYKENQDAKYCLLD